MFIYNIQLLMYLFIYSESVDVTIDNETTGIHHENAAVATIHTKDPKNLRQ